MAEINNTEKQAIASVDAAWDINRKPATPHAWDVEFDGALPSPWTLGAGAVGTAIDAYTAFSTAGEFRYSLNSRRKSYLMIQPTTASMVQVLSRALTAPATDFYVVMRFSYLAKRAVTTDNRSNCYLRLGVDNNNYAYIYANECDATSTHEVVAGRVSGGVATELGSYGVFSSGPTNIEYIAIHKKSTTYHYWCGTSQGTWGYLGNNTVAGTPADVIVFCGDAGTTSPGNAIFGFDFIRFKDTSDFDLL